jgi:mono/diheme cytochrome c family protein
LLQTLLRTVAVLLAAQLLSSKPATQSSSARASATSTLTFYKDVLPILQQHCQTCHRPGEIAPMPFVTYKETRPWARSIGDAVRARKMPPWFADPCCGHFAEDPSLTPQQIQTLIAWAEPQAGTFPSPMSSSRCPRQ